jgi:hypothetical protein
MKKKCPRCSNTFYCANTCGQKGYFIPEVLRTSCLCPNCAKAYLEIDFISQGYQEVQSRLLRCSIPTKEQKGAFEVRRMSRKLGLNANS